MCAHTLLYIILEGVNGRQMEIKEDRGQLKVKGRMDLNNTSLLFRLLVESVRKCEHECSPNNLVQLQTKLGLKSVSGVLTDSFWPSDWQFLAL